MLRKATGARIKARAAPIRAPRSARRPHGDGLRICTVQVTTRRAVLPTSARAARVPTRPVARGGAAARARDSPSRGAAAAPPVQVEDAQPGCDDRVVYIAAPDSAELSWSAAQVRTRRVPHAPSHCSA